MANSRRVTDELKSTAAPVSLSATGQRIYDPDGDTLGDFLIDRSIVSIIMGPLGSAKTIALLHKIFGVASEAAASPDGVRRSRAFLVRNTYSDLVTTTMAKWREWFPEDQYGKIMLEKPPRVVVRLNDIELEIWFLALDQQDDIRKLRSLEPSIIAFNELQYIPKELFDEATSRVGRYPADVSFEKRTKMVIADMNAPDEAHWTAYLYGLVEPPETMSEADRKSVMRPKEWALFSQPPAVLELFHQDGSHKGFVVNPEAENLLYVGEAYYRDQLVGKTVDWVRNRLMVQVGRVADGAAVWPMFQTSVHVSKTRLIFNPYSALHCGLDFGRKPAAVFGQHNGRIYVPAEFHMTGVSSEIFAPQLKQFIAERFPDAGEILFWGDPAGAYPGQVDERTSYDIFKAHGLHVREAPFENNLEIRLETAGRVLNEMHNGQPKFVLDPGCTMLKSAMSGGYRYRKIRGSQVYGTHDREDAKPDKHNPYSHIADALQYLLLGMGEGRSLLRGSRPPAQPVQTALHRRTGNVVSMRGGRHFGRG